MPKKLKSTNIIVTDLIDLREKVYNLDKLIGQEKRRFERIQQGRYATLRLLRWELRKLESEK